MGRATLEKLALSRLVLEIVGHVARTWPAPPAQAAVLGKPELAGVPTGTDTPPPRKKQPLPGSVLEVVGSKAQHSNAQATVPGSHGSYEKLPLPRFVLEADRCGIEGEEAARG